MTSDLFNLAGKVVVITGASGLLGRQHADAVARAAGLPVLLDINVEEAKSQAQRLNKKYGTDVLALNVDITNEDSVAGSVDKILKYYGHVDALINNAANNPKVEASSASSFSRLENFSLDQWSADIAVGLTGAFLCSKHFGTAMAKSSGGGVIINISSDLGLIAPDQRLYEIAGLNKDEQPVKPVTYSVTKSGIIGLTRYLSTYWPEKVRANAICPGGVEAGQSTEFLEKVQTRIPLKRLARPEEYQGIIVFLLSDASSYLNGAVIPIDGGRSAW